MRLWPTDLLVLTTDLLVLTTTVLIVGQCLARRYPAIIGMLRSGLNTTSSEPI